jgi:uncharacterized protein
MKLVVREGKAGRGVFADEAIRAGELIIRFTGPFLRYADTTPQTYALQVGPDLYIGASGGFDDYINHSCAPNAGMKIQGAGQDVSVNLHAIRDIGEGEEICFDYSTTMAEDDFEMPCRCGAPSCRGLVRDGKHLPGDVWERYLGLGILPEYVVESRRKLEPDAQGVRR